MRIDGIVTCVGELYAELLARTLPVWLRTLDSVTIVTDAATTSCMGVSLAALTVTDAFARNGAYFNKGAALNEGITAAAPTDWVLSFDADVLPPDNWREIAEPLLVAGNLYGAARKPQSTRRWVPSGFFQLFHATDRNARYKPLFPDRYAHAGRYDTVFMRRWPKCRHKQLPFTLEHLGEARRHWCGVGNDGAMRELMRGGVRQYVARDEQLGSSRPQEPMEAGTQQAKP